MVEVIDERPENRAREERYRNLVELTRSFLGQDYDVSTVLEPYEFAVFPANQERACIEERSDGIRVHLPTFAVLSYNRQYDDLALKLAERYEESTQEKFLLRKT